MLFSTTLRDTSVLKPETKQNNKLWGFYHEQKLTLNQEEEAQNPSGGDDETGDDEGHPPGRWDEDSGDEGA